MRPPVVGMDATKSGTEASPSKVGRSSFPYTILFTHRICRRAKKENRPVLTSRERMVRAKLKMAITSCFDSFDPYITFVLKLGRANK